MQSFTEAGQWLETHLTGKGNNSKSINKGWFTTTHAKSGPRFREATPNSGMSTLLSQVL